LALPPVRRLDLGRDLSFSLLPYLFNGLLAVEIQYTGR